MSYVDELRAELQRAQNEKRELKALVASAESRATEIERAVREYLAAQADVEEVLRASVPTEPAEYRAHGARATAASNRRRAALDALRALVLTEAPRG